MKNSLAILFILFGCGILLTLTELLLSLPVESIRATLIPIPPAIAVAVAIALSCLGSGIVMVTSDNKYKHPSKNEEDRY